MTVSDITKIIATVATVQLIADLLSNYFIFRSPSYLLSVSQFERARDRRDKTLASIIAKQQQDNKSNNNKPSSKSAERDQKKLSRENEEVSTIAAEVARRHTMASFYTSIAFLFLYKILAVEYAGKIVGVLPFRPFGLLQRLTFHSLGGEEKLSAERVNELWMSLDNNDEGAASYGDVGHASEACAFAFVYMLCSLSVKMLVNMIFGTKPPRGADEGMGTFMDSPQSQKMFKTFGLDVEEVKEARSALGF